MLIKCTTPIGELLRALKNHELAGLSFGAQTTMELMIRRALDERPSEISKGSYGVDALRKLYSILFPPSAFIGVSRTDKVFIIAEYVYYLIKELSEGVE